MKKSLILCSVVFAWFTVLGQSVTTQTAYNFLKEANRSKTLDDKQENLGEAKKAIDKASLNTETLADAETWFYKSLIYINLFRLNSNDSTFYNTSLTSMQKAYELDKKDKFRSEILVNVDTIRQNIYQRGVRKFNQKQYEESMNLIAQAANLYKIINLTDTALLVTAAIAADRAGKYDRACSFYITALEAGKSTPEIYSSLNIWYTRLKDKPNAIKYLNAGYKLFPNNPSIIQAEINMYLGFGEDQKALVQLQKIIKMDTTRYIFYYAIGTLYDKIYNDTANSNEKRKDALTQAFNSYQKAINLKPDYFDPYFNYGILYNNIAAEIFFRANDLPADNEKDYAKLKTEAEANLYNAIPYLEKAMEISPDDIDVLMALKKIYLQLNMKEKSVVISEKINALKK